VRRGSTFAYSHLSMLTQLKLIIAFKNTSSLAFASSITGVSNVSVSHVFRKMREAVSTWVCENPVKFDGDDIVEIDETLIEALRGDDTTRTGKRTLRTWWVLGMVSHRTGKVHLDILPDRTKETIVPLVLARVAPGAVVFSDSLRAYLGLRQWFRHYIVVHSRAEMTRHIESLGMVAHTNTIEGSWSILRTILHARRGFTAAHWPLFRDEMVWIFSGEDLLSILEWHN
jgi:transposase